jgi:hypothetical protein
MRKHREVLWDAVLGLFVLAAAVVLVRYLGVHDNPERDVIEAERAAEERAVQAMRAAEERAVQAILRLGGKVLRDEKAPGKPVIAVFLNTPAMTDAGLEVLGELRQLRELDLTGSRVTASGLKELAGLQQLQTLHLGETQCFAPRGWAPDFLEALVRLRQLKTLTLYVADFLRGLAALQRSYRETLQRWLHEHLPGCRVIIR